MRDISRTILEGQPGKMVYCHDIVHLKNNMFFLCGQLVALSLAQGGHGVRCFAPAMFNLMIGEQIKPPSTDSLDIVSDPDLAEKIRKILYIARNMNCLLYSEVI